ncbi:DNA polymerase beta superfamily protein [Halobacillus faecis]|uniref:DNA polymerase beta superfamily protein n=1 Tax=Halobacillus faecis TaxID=360184 RepID=UPI00142E9B76|nr:nucleotidyltransferase domain-containing protein [Halobacillus faecis]
MRRDTKSFVNLTLKHIENPLFIVLTGSRMYGFHDEESDWDVYAVFIHPSNQLLGLYEPDNEIMTPEIKLYNRTVSVKGEEVQLVFQKLIQGNMKTFERIFSPEAIMKMDAYKHIRSLSKRFFTQRLIESYMNYIEEMKREFQRTDNIKFLIYSLRSAMTADLLLKSSVFNTRVKDIYPLYSNSNLKNLLKSKRNGSPSPNVQKAFDEINTIQDYISTMRFKLPKESKEKDVKRAHEILVSLRMQYLLSRRDFLSFK